MKAIDVHKDKILGLTCLFCQRPKFTRSFRDEIARADLIYCTNCGLITKFGKLGLVDLKIGRDYSINILPNCDSEPISLQYQTKFNTGGELVAAIGKKQICNLCQGSKQNWEPHTKMMIDCSNCQGTGII